MFYISQKTLSDEVKKKIYQGFSQQAIQATGINGITTEPVSFEISDKSEFIGAVVVQEFWGQLHIKYLFIEEKFRGQGVGRKLMDHALNFGKSRGCQFAFVETMSFQAPKFYQKFGFEIDFSRSGYAQGTSFHYLSKKLE